VKTKGTKAYSPLIFQNTFNLLESVMAFVIRSMSTTDYRAGQKPTPYHIYLKRAERRTNSLWQPSEFQCAEFLTFQAAQETVKELGLDMPYRSYEIVPQNWDGPKYWEHS